MQIFPRIFRRPAAITLLAAFSFTGHPASAEPVLNRALSSAAVTPQSGCAQVLISFNFRVRYISHFPINGGRELRIRVAPLDPARAEEDMDVQRESLRVPVDPSAAIRAIEFERNGSGPALVVFFTDHVDYHVAQGGDFASIIVTVAGPDAPKTCRAYISQLTAPAGTAIPGKDDRTTRSAPSSDTAKLAGTMKDARAALTGRDHRRAIQLLTKVLSYPENQHSAEAQELLGVARERNGQMAHAKAEYETYLRKYPKGEGAARVRQRLTAILTADKEPSRVLRKAGTPAKTEAPAKTLSKSNRLTTRSTPEGTTAKTGATTSRLRTAETDPDEFQWELTGSVSQFYFRNQQFTRFTELESRRKTDDDDVFENSVLSSADVSASVENSKIRAKSRFSGSHDADFTENGQDQIRISAAYVEAEEKDWAAFTRIGRQTRNTGGILGRFDGALFSWQTTDELRINVTVGSPVDSSRDEPFLYNRYFYGVSADIGPLWGALNGSLFFVEQRADSFVDRRAVGAEMRYFDANKSLFGTVDYDIYFNELSYANIAGSWTFPDRSTVSLSADYVHSPTLMTSNALQGQNANSLDDLLATFSRSMIKELAHDRTTESQSATLGFSRPLNDTFQISMDATIFDTGGNPASGGVAEVEAPGTEYFASAQLIGTGILTERDIFLVGARYANTATSDLYLLDTYSRYPVTDHLNVRPRVKVGYRDLKSIDGEEYFVIPSFTTTYQMQRAWNFEVDIGGKLSTRETPTSREDSAEIYVTAGYRYDF